RRDDEMYDFGRPGTMRAQSGVSAAKELLGLPQIPDEEPEPEEVDTEAGEGIESNDEPRHTGESIPQYDAETAEKELRKAKSLKALDKSWQAIVADFRDTDRELPVDLQAVYEDMLDKLDDAGGKL